MNLVINHVKAACQSQGADPEKIASWMECVAGSEKTLEYFRSVLRDYNRMITQSQLRGAQEIPDFCFKPTQLQVSNLNAPRVSLDSLNERSSIERLTRSIDQGITLIDELIGNMEAGNDLINVTEVHQKINQVGDQLKELENHSQKANGQFLKRTVTDSRLDMIGLLTRFEKIRKNRVNTKLDTTTPLRDVWHSSEDGEWTHGPTGTNHYSLSNTNYIYNKTFE